MLLVKFLQCILTYDPACIDLSEGCGGWMGHEQLGGKRRVKKHELLLPIYVSMQLLTALKVVNQKLKGALVFGVFDHENWGEGAGDLIYGVFY